MGGRGSASGRSQSAYEKVVDSWHDENSKRVEAVLRTQQEMLRREAEEMFDPEVWENVDRKTFVEEHVREFTLTREHLKSIQDALEDEYTETMRNKFGDPPKLIFTHHENHQLNSDIVDGKRVYNVQMNPWTRTGEQHSSIVRHEFGHWVHTQTVMRDWSQKKRIDRAGKKDFENLKKRFGARSFRTSSDVGEAIFGKKYSALSSEEKRAAAIITDSFGSVSNGHYDVGHGSAYFKKQNKGGLSYGEAIANLNQLRKTKYNSLNRSLFPNLSKVLDDMRK